MTADVQRELADELVGLMKHHINPAIGWWRYADAKGETFDRELLAERYRRAATDVQALIADAENRAAARALRAAANDVRQNHGTASGTAKRIDAQAAALDPSGAAEGAGR